MVVMWAKFMDDWRECQEEVKEGMTNADYIRSMTDEELAQWVLYDAVDIGKEYTDSVFGLIKWLKQPRGR